MKRLLAVLLLLPLLTLTVRAENVEDELGLQTEALIEELPQDAAERLPEGALSESPNLWESLCSLLFGALTESRDAARAALRLCAVLLVLVTLFSVADLSGRAQGAITLAGALGISAAVLSTFRAMIGMATQTVSDITTYSSFLMPVLASASAMTGTVTASSALYAGTLLFSELLMQLISKLLIPAVFFYLAVATAEAALSGSMLSELRNFVGWLISKSLRVILFVFLGYMSLTGVISAATDATAVKATKAAVSGMIPVVGGMISDASETLLASAAALKNAVGVFGMLAVLAVCLVPFFRVGAHYLLLKLTAAVSGTVGLKPHVQLIRSFSTAMGYLLAMCGACGLLLLISCVCFLKVVI